MKDYKHFMQAMLQKDWAGLQGGSLGDVGRFVLGTQMSGRRLTCQRAAGFRDLGREGGMGGWASARVPVGLGGQRPPPLCLRWHVPCVCPGCALHSCDGRAHSRWLRVT